MTKGLNLYQSYVPLTGDVLLRAYWYDCERYFGGNKDKRVREHKDLLCSTLVHYGFRFLSWDTRIPCSNWAIDMRLLLQCHAYAFVERALHSFNDLTTNAVGRRLDRKYYMAWCKWRDEVSNLPTTWMLVAEIFNPRRMYADLGDSVERHEEEFHSFYKQFLTAWQVNFKDNTYYEPQAPCEKVVSALCCALIGVHRETNKWV